MHGSGEVHGPFQVLARIGKAAYQLKLPVDAKIHNTFHVSQLKLFHGSLPVAAHIPEWFHGRDLSKDLQPLALLGRRTIKHQDKAMVQFLIQWEGQSAQQAT